MQQCIIVDVSSVLIKLNDVDSSSDIGSSNFKVFSKKEFVGRNNMPPGEVDYYYFTLMETIMSNGVVPKMPKIKKTSSKKDFTSSTDRLIAEKMGKITWLDSIEKELGLDKLITAEYMKGEEDKMEAETTSDTPNQPQQHHSSENISSNQSLHQSVNSNYNTYGQNFNANQYTSAFSNGYLFGYQYSIQHPSQATRNHLDDKEDLK